MLFFRAAPQNHAGAVARRSCSFKSAAAFAARFLSFEGYRPISALGSKPSSCVMHASKLPVASVAVRNRAAGDAVRLGAHLRSPPKLQVIAVETLGQDLGPRPVRRRRGGSSAPRFSIDFFTGYSRDGSKRSAVRALWSMMSWQATRVERPFDLVEMRYRTSSLSPYRMASVRRSLSGRSSQTCPSPSKPLPGSASVLLLGEERG